MKRPVVVLGYHPPDFYSPLGQLLCPICCSTSPLVPTVSATQLKRPTRQAHSSRFRGSPSIRYRVVAYGQSGSLKLVKRAFISSSVSQKNQGDLAIQARHRRVDLVVRHTNMPQG